MVILNPTIVNIIIHIIFHSLNILTALIIIILNIALIMIILNISLIIVLMKARTGE